MFGEYLARWIQSYRDLPLCLNQWANVVRWELRPRLFLRTTEFLWQEGHTAHATEADAAAYARQIHADVYRAVLEDVLAIPVITGLKTEAERFAGATATLTCEGMMRDGKALQLATSHELGQNFARAFDITYTDRGGRVPALLDDVVGQLDPDGRRHDHGPRRRRRAAAAAGRRAGPGRARRGQGRPRGAAACERLERELAAAGIRARVDRRTDVGLGRRLTDWELKGVPVRLEVGPRDLAEGTVSLARRDRDGREAVAIDAAAAAASTAVGAVHDALLAEAAEALGPARSTSPTSPRRSRRPVRASRACPGPRSGRRVSAYSTRPRSPSAP